MLYMQKIGDYLKILTDDEVKDFVVKIFGEYFKSTKEKLYSKLREEQNLRKIAESLYIFLTTSNEVEKYAKILIDTDDNCKNHYNIEIFYLFDPELQLINTKPMIRNKLKEFLNKLKKSKQY